MDREQIQLVLGRAREQAAATREENQRQEQEEILKRADDHRRHLEARVNKYLEDSLEGKVRDALVKGESRVLLYSGDDEEFARVLCHVLSDAGEKAAVETFIPHGEDDPRHGIGHGRGDDTLEYWAYMIVK